MVISLPLYGQSDNEAIMRAINSVSPFDVKSWCEELTKDEYRGRRTGDIGFDLAADWMVAHYQGLGLTSMFEDGSYLQVFDQPYTEVNGTGGVTSHFVISGDTISKDYEYLVDFFPTALSGNGEVTGDVVYAGYGISAPELGYDIYKGVDVKGKIVVVEKGSPYKGRDTDTMLMWQSHSGHRAKIVEAAKQGAAGIVVVVPATVCQPSSGDDIVAVYVSERVAQDLTKGSGTTLEELREGLQAKKPKAMELKSMLTLKAETVHHPDTKGANVVAMIEGSDPVLKNEYIVLGAHLDHLGMIPEIFVGALDNVSGCAVVMGVAKALMESGAELKRSVVFVNFGAEEVGLVGSQYFAENFPFDSKKIDVMVNYDMVGKGRGFNIVSSMHAKEHTDIFGEQIAKWVHRPSRESAAKDWRYNTYPNTDGGVFENMKIGHVHFSLQGAYEDIYYHHPNDRLWQLDYNLMTDVVRATAVSVIAVANR